MHAKFSNHRMYFSKKPTLFQEERGMKFIAEYKKCKVQSAKCKGLLATIVVILNIKQNSH